MLNEGRIKFAIGLLSFAGLAISGYLTYVHYYSLHPICLTGGCETVQSSSYAVFLRIPVALIGVIGYVLILTSLLVRGGWGALLGVISSFAGLAYSIYLTYLELFQIHAICQWCVTSAALIALIAILMSIRFLRDEKVQAGGHRAS